MKAVAIKNRLSNAFSGLRKLKSKQDSQEESPSGSEPATPAQEAVELPILPILHQDDMGFPLAIFTKVGLHSSTLDAQSRFADRQHLNPIFIFRATKMTFHMNCLFGKQFK